MAPWILIAAGFALVVIAARDVRRRTATALRGGRAGLAELARTRRGLFAVASLLPLGLLLVAGGALWLLWDALV
jgi:uncharacterized membrane protein YecN with MAPEG domain